MSDFALPEPDTFGNRWLEDVGRPPVIFPEKVMASVNGHQSPVPTGRFWVLVTDQGQAPGFLADSWGRRRFFDCPARALMALRTHLGTDRVLSNHDLL
ncbi:MAG TPA: hypothetical protein VD932_02490 [Aquabacterium sp.]|nr:hypothetical protein [Aquabacterium sp.]